MAKIVKFCDSCEESFAEKFGFCPNCGEKLQAFEMNPLGGATAISEPVKSETDSADSVIEEKTFSTDAVTAAPVLAHSVPEPVVNPVETKNFDAPKADDFQPAVSAGKTEPSVEAPKTFAASAGAKSSDVNESNDRKNALNSNFSSAGSAATATDDGFHVTVIEEKNVKQRNTLLLGALFLMTTIAIGSTIYSLFSKDLLIGSIGDESTLNALVAAVEPPPMETEPPPKKDKDEGGGGGGGGKEEQQEASKGRLPPQSQNPITPPDVNIPQLTNPTLKLKQETQGNIKREITEERTGIPTSLNLSASNGTGSGGGIGSGRGTGVGGGIGTGEGNGIGSGSGNGRGTGNGDGTGPGSGIAGPPPPPPKKVEPPKPPVTTAMRIVSKPRANYTDAARQNQVQGTVTLRVTFLASGQIGSISPVSGLPYGLTEQAIAAARQIRFEPQMVNGSPVPVTKQVQYSFTIY